MKLPALKPRPATTEADAKSPTAKSAGASAASSARSLPVPPARPAAAPVLSVPKRRPRKILLMAGVLLTVVFAVAVYVLVSRSGEKVAVVGLAQDVSWGEVITREDLMEVQLSQDTALRPVSWTSVDSVIGKRAAADLSAGSLLTDASTEIASAVPPEGKALVGVQVSSAQAPVTPMSPGDEVWVLETGESGATDASEQTASVQPVRGVVFAVNATGTGGERTVDVLVDESAVIKVAEWSATGRSAIVLVPRGR